LGVSQDVQTLDQLNRAKRNLSLPTEFGGIHVLPSPESKVELAHYASFVATVANMSIDYESESLSPMYDLIGTELMHFITSTWAVQLRNSFDTIDKMGGVFGIGSRGAD
jgi:hypothetical protein